MTTFKTDITSLHAAYSEGLGADAAVEAVYAEMERIADPGILITTVAIDDARAAARALGPFDPETRPLWGVPFAVKDNIDVTGLPTTAACPAFAYTPERSAPVVNRLIAAGALLVGKTNLDQFASGLVGVRTPYPVPRNAVDSRLVPGGSSSGSGVAVAHGLVGFALGTDTAGSGRVPAALNNIVGLKPTRGMLSTRGVVPACRTLDCLSVFAGTVDDAWKVASVAAGYDEDDPYSRDIPLGAPSLPPAMRLGIPDSGSLIIDGSEAASAFDAALALLVDFGAPRDIDLRPFFEAAALLYEGPWIAERYAGIRSFFETNRETLHPITRRIIEGAETRSAADAFSGLYRLAALARATAPVWQAIDVLVVPSIPDVCTLDAIAADPIGANARLGIYTNFVNLLDLCALAVPGPTREDGLPSGVTLIAPAGRDHLLTALATEFHARAGVMIGATGRPLPERRKLPAAPPPGTVAIAVVGAHLSGMPLNHELAGRGGSFVKAVATTPTYRLYALPGAPPRPGLVRVNRGGAAIETEVWALSPSAFAEFVQAIPAPLGVGTVNLADGTSVKGFLCEAVATEDASDVTEYGGWRAYVSTRA